MYFLLLAAGLISSDITIRIDNLIVDSGISEVVIKVTNNGNSTAESVFIDCVFMSEDERAIDIGKVLLTDLAPGQTKYDKAGIFATAGVAKASCYVDKIR